METELRPVLARFAKERNANERFGDWCDRVFLTEQIANCDESLDLLPREPDKLHD